MIQIWDEKDCPYVQHKVAGDETYDICELNTKPCLIEHGLYRCETYEEYLREIAQEKTTLKTEIITDSELPYRIEWGRLKSAGDSPSSAMVRMLSVASLIPIDIRDRKEVARYIFWNYHAFAPWAEIIHILDTNSFTELKV